MGYVKQPHYVPEFYLKRFTDVDGKFHVYVKSKKAFLPGRQNPRKFATEGKFYDTPIANIHELVKWFVELHPTEANLKVFGDVQYIEHYLGRIETDIANIFRSLDEDAVTIQSIELQAKIAYFMYSTYVRTKATRNVYTNISQHIYTQLDKILPKERNHEKERFHPQKAKEIQFANLFDMKQLLEFSRNLLFGYSWNIGINNTKFDFIVSDHPAMIASLQFNGDICIIIIGKRGGDNIMSNLQ